MLVNIIKFFHILCVLSLLGGMLFSAFHGFKKNIPLKKTLIILSLFAILTGTALIYPKHFTFHTPWIEAAYLLSLSFIVGIALIVWLEKKNKPKVLLFFISFISIILLLFIIHDAVTKSTFLF